MRLARSLLLVCLIVGLAAILAAARGHLRELEQAYRDGERRSALGELRLLARESSRAMRHELEQSPVIARYSPAGELLRPAPPWALRPWEPPTLTPAAVAMGSGDFRRALEEARTSADRAAVYLARGEQTKDPKALRKALSEEAFAGTDIYYFTALRVFRLEDREPDPTWLDDVSALLGGTSDGAARALLAKAGCDPVGDAAERRRLALLRPRPGAFRVEGRVYFGEKREDGILLRTVDAGDTGTGPLAVPFDAPFDHLRQRGGPGAAAAASVPGRARLIGYYGLAALILLAGSAYAFLAIGRAFRLAKDKSEFVANVTHELKTPLANIKLYAESLAAGRVREEDRDEFYDTILREGNRLERLVEGLLHAARGARLEKSPVDLNALLREVEARWRARLEREGFDFSVEADALPRVAADRETLVRALDNLLDNARKYSRAERRIVLKGSAENGCVHLTVLDRGPGIPVQDRARVLRPFTRVESADRKETAGTGLGLSLVVACMEAHGGEISIGDAPGRGAAVSLVLPLEESA